MYFDYSPGRWRPLFLTALVLIGRERIRRRYAARIESLDPRHTAIPTLGGDPLGLSVVSPRRRRRPRFRFLAIAVSASLEALLTELLFASSTRPFTAASLQILPFSLQGVRKALVDFDELPFASVDAKYNP